MADLYKGIAGSPITYLTSDISANQTTISIADDSALPDAPNICTIGYGEQLETIKYETKSNGVLQNVTRGIEGTPRAWPAGTEVARFFTAYDHNEIIDGIVGVDSDLETHKADYAKEATKFSIIIADGFKGSGYYYKKNGIVTLSFAIELDTESQFVRGQDLFIMPVGFRPITSTHVVGSNYIPSSSPTMNLASFTLYNTGQLRVLNNSLSGSDINGSVSYYAGGGTE